MPWLLGRCHCVSRGGSHSFIEGDGGGGGGGGGGGIGPLTSGPSSQPSALPHSGFANKNRSRSFLANYLRGPKGCAPGVPRGRCWFT